MYALDALDALGAVDADAGGLNASGSFVLIGLNAGALGVLLEPLALLALLALLDAGSDGTGLVAPGLLAAGSGEGAVGAVGAFGTAGWAGVAGCAVPAGSADAVGCVVRVAT